MLTIRDQAILPVSSVVIGKTDVSKQNEVTDF